MRRIGLGLLAVGLAGGAAAGDGPLAEPTPPAIVVRAVRPGRQLEEVLKLFEGTRAPHPAAALAAWRQATGRHDALSKTAQALIALCNPDMVRELRTLDGAEANLQTAGPPLRWAVRLPADDGTIAAIGSAAALTDGGEEPPIGTARVDRLGPPGSPLLATRPDGPVAVAGDRAMLERALDPPPRDGPQWIEVPELASGWVASLDVPALGAPGGLSRGLAAGLDALECRWVEGWGGLEGETLSWTFAGEFGERPPGSFRPIDARWLRAIPATDTAAVLVLALDPRPDAWDAAFRIADRVEKSDPARAKTAPLRSRLNLIALASGVWPEVEVYPFLEGVTVVMGGATEGRPRGLAVVLHTDTPEAAARVAGKGLRPLTRAWLKARPVGDEPDPVDGAAAMRLGQIDGQPVELALRGPDVLIAWGEGWAAACLDANEHPERSAAASLEAGWEGRGRPPERLGAVWPGRLPGLEKGPLAEAMVGAPPLLWTGTTEGLTTRDVVRWGGLQGVVRRFLEAIPQAPTPATAAP